MGSKIQAHNLVSTQWLPSLLSNLAWLTALGLTSSSQVGLRMCSSPSRDTSPSDQADPQTEAKWPRTQSSSSSWYRTHILGFYTAHCYQTQLTSENWVKKKKIKQSWKYFPPFLIFRVNWKKKSRDRYFRIRGKGLQNQPSKCFRMVNQSRKAWEPSSQQPQSTHRWQDGATTQSSLPGGSRMEEGFQGLAEMTPDLPGEGPYLAE